MRGKNLGKDKAWHPPFGTGSIGGASGLAIHSNTPHGKLVRLPDDLMHFFPKGTTMCRQGVGDDGSCFYHTMAAGLNFDDWQHQASERTRIGSGSAFEKASKTRRHRVVE